MSLWASVRDGSIASAAAAVLTNPVEVVKIRLQLQGELMKEGTYTKKYNGMLHGLWRVGRTEGIRGLQKGLPASIAHQVTQNGVRFGCYPILKDKVNSVIGPGLATNLIAGAGAGIIGAFCGSPAFMIKIRLQAQCKDGVGVGQQHHYKGFLDAAYRIATEKGIAGLFHGYKTACVRTAVGSASQLTTYDTMKASVIKHGGYSPSDVKVHFIASAMSGVAITAAMNPFDVLITRCYNNPNMKDTSNVFIAFRDIIATEGPKGLYKGATGLFMRMTPHTIFTFIFLEQIKEFHKRRALAAQPKALPQVA